VFLFIQIRMTKISSIKEWLVSNISILIGISLLIELSHSLISIYLCSSLVLVSLLAEVLIIMKEYRLKKQIEDMKV